jgi:hypothetical protein
MIELIVINTCFRVNTIKNFTLDMFVSNFWSSLSFWNNPNVGACLASGITSPGLIIRACVLIHFDRLLRQLRI